MASPRKFLAELSPSTHRTASITFDFPHPFGPTTAVISLGKGIVVGSTKDLKPASLIFFKRTTIPYALTLRNKMRPVDMG